MTLNDLRLYLMNKNIKVGNQMYSHSELGGIFKEFNMQIQGEKSTLLIERQGE